MRSLMLGATSAPRGWLQCQEYCTAVKDSNYFTYKSENSVSMVDNFLGDVCLMECLSCSIVCAGQIVRSLVFHNAPIASLVTSPVLIASALLLIRGTCFKRVIAGDVLSRQLRVVLGYMEFLYLWRLPLMPTNVQSSAELTGPANGSPMTVWINLVSLQKTESSFLTALPVDMDIMVACTEDPPVRYYKATSMYTLRSVINFRVYNRNRQA